MLRLSLPLILLSHSAYSMLLGWVESPGYPSGYQPHASLNWSRCAPKGHTLSIRLMHLDLEDSRDCENDGVKISSNGNLISVLCGKREFEELQSTVNPLLISSPGGCLSLSFYSDYSNTKRYTGFRGFYTVQDFDECDDPENGCTQFCHNFVGGYHCSCRHGYHLAEDKHTCTVTCGEDLSGLNRGHVATPSWPGAYAENSNCQYTLSVEAHLQLELLFSGIFDVEQGPDGQCIDALMIETHSGSLGPFCGQTPPPSPLLTHSHYVKIHFTSDGFGTNKGFSFHFQTRGKVCPAVVTSHSTVVPEKPEHHPGQIVTVTCEVGYVLTIQGTQNLETQYEATCQSTGEWLPNHPCQPVNCGHPDIPDDSILQLVGSDIGTHYNDQIQFSCSSKYYTLEGEGKRMRFTENMICAGGVGKDSCQKDSGGPFVVPMVSSGNGPYYLFGIVSWGPPCEQKQGSVTNNKGYYTRVENYVDWITETINQWLRKLQTDKQIELLTLFMHLCRFLYLSVCECWRLPDNDPPMYGEVQSPQYPQPYSSNLQEQWDLNVPEGYRIRLTFTHMDIEASAGCYYDFLTVLYDGKVLGRFCGHENSAEGNHPGNQPIFSPGNRLTLNFQTDNNNPERHQPVGFLAQYQAIDIDECSAPIPADGSGPLCTQICLNTLGSYLCSCHHGYELRSDQRTCVLSCGGGIFDEPEGHLYSPGYPNSPTHAMSCQYIISVEAGFTVSLNFSDNFHIESMDTEQGLTCPHHWLQMTIQDKESTKMCGTKSPGLINTNSNTVKLDYHIDDEGLSNGWSLDYSTQRVQCPVPAKVAKGRVTPVLTEYFYRDYIYVRCDQGYKLMVDGQEIESFSTMCQSNGQWHLRLPECHIIDCGEPEPLLNGGVTFLSGFQNQYLSVVRYHCNEPYYSLLGGETVRFTCEADRKWRSNYDAVVSPLCLPVCGKPTVLLSAYQRIIGGSDAPADTIPWQVLVNVGGRRGGGMMIADRWIMTAAHNVIQKNVTETNDNVRIFMGRTEIKPFELSHMTAASVHVHPGYNNINDQDYNNDIALLKLHDPITFNSTVMPICLPAEDATYDIGTMGFLCVSVCECWKLPDSDSVMHGEIQSPQYPQPYPTSLKEWNLIGPEGYQIQLSITHLDIKASAGCDQDSLTVLYDQKLIGKFCGQENSSDHPGKEPIISPGNRLTVIFKTSISTPELHQHVGFSASYKAIDIDECSKLDSGVVSAPLCSQICINTPGSYRCSCHYGYKLHLDQRTCVLSCHDCVFDKHKGHLSSPGYPRPSPPFLSCKYIISVEPRFTVTLNFSNNFHIESVDTQHGPDCIRHWLQVTIPGRKPMKLCGAKSPGVIATNSNTVRLDYHTDEEGLSSGWRLDYSTQINFTCEADGKWRSNHNSIVTPKCEPVCGKPTVLLSAYQRIIGGSDAPADTIPWQVLVNVGGHRGGGMMIADRWIMTAAHNVVQQNVTETNDNVWIFMGRTEIKPFELSHITAASVHVHPGYNNINDQDYNNDIALLKLHDPITFNSTVMPICLPAEDATYDIGTMGLVSGFGLMNTKSNKLFLSNKLKYVNLPVVAQETCSASIIQLQRTRADIPNLTNNMFCAGIPEGGKDSCQADGAADVVLSCALVEEGAGLGGMGGGAAFKRTPATLVFRNIAVASDESLEMLTPFVPPSVPDPDLLLFEAKASSVEVPNADVLLHADCNEQEVMCEISRYTPRGSQESSDPAYFMVSLSVEGVEFNSALILQTLTVERDQSTLIQNKLGLPLSQSGTLLTEVIFVVFSHVKSVSAPLRGDVLLNCGFRQHETRLSQEVGIEWRLQHRGKGRKVLEMKTRLDDSQENTVVHAERRATSMDVSEVVGAGNVSLSLNRLKVLDEGTYICTVSLGPFHAQQVIQLHVIQPPHVSLSEEKVVMMTTSRQTLSCHCNKYYPLDAQMEWLSLSPSDTEPTVLRDQGSLSSHRQHGDGTYSLSSHLNVPPTVSPGTKITCRVTHPALDSEVSVSVVIERAEPASYWYVLGFLIITALFFYQVMR
ncbi:hypothetical protein INR49_001644 [Caranx melampygus]|nr:hypothetical protein INR49_001644 [Caranx melampygus]